MSEVQARPGTGGPRDVGKTSSGRRGRRKGVEIKAGTARQARLEAGLSLGQVAGTEISRTAIISWRPARPSRPWRRSSLSHCARGGRLTSSSAGRARWNPVRRRQIEIERLTVEDDHAGALAVAETLLAVERDPEMAARIKFLMATRTLGLRSQSPPAASPRAPEPISSLPATCS